MVTPAPPDDEELVALMQMSDAEKDAWCKRRIAELETEEAMGQ